MSAEVNDVRDTMRSLMGANYITSISYFVPLLESEMRRTGKSVMAAGTTLAGAISNENARLRLVACMAEMAEPDPAFPLPLSPTP